MSAVCLPIWIVLATSVSVKHHQMKVKVLTGPQMLSTSNEVL